MVYTDTTRRLVFRKAIFQICVSDEPTRGQLREIGGEAARAVGRPKPWGGPHLYTLIHFERWPKYGIHPDLFRAVMQRAGRAAMNGTTLVKVHARGVREGAIVLARSRRCARVRCGVHFVPVTPNQRYCGVKCAAQMAGFRKRRCATSRRQGQTRKRGKPG